MKPVLGVLGNEKTLYPCLLSGTGIELLDEDGMNIYPAKERSYICQRQPEGTKR